jgi:predicted methyltransferase
VARDVLADVAIAVGLREGRRGVEDVLRHLAGDPAATRDLSRRTGIPVPLVAAVCGELRRAGLLTRGRPARLSPVGRELAGRLGGGAACACPSCAGLGVAVPPAYAALAEPLAALLAGVPPADRALDQVHCTVATRLRRLAYLEEAGALAGRAVLLVGDDDQMAVSIAFAAARLGVPPPARLAMVDVDEAVVAFARRALAGLGAPAELAVHDLRRPLPAGLLAGFDAVFTDPPYTAAGAELFLRRGAAALRPGPGAQAFLCLGSKPPEETARLQRAIAGMGFAIHRLVRNFNEYVGAGALAGTSHLYHLVGGPRLDLAEQVQAPLYTAQERTSRRGYACRACGERVTVGAGLRWATVEDLRRAGCPRCAGTAFRPGRRAPSPGRA